MNVDEFYTKVEKVAKALYVLKNNQEDETFLDWENLFESEKDVVRESVISVLSGENDKVIDALDSLSYDVNALCEIVDL